MNLKTAGWRPDTSVDNIAVVVVSRRSRRFGQLGKLVDHDWRESGEYYVYFADGKMRRYPDGLCKGDPESPVTLFYRHRDARGTEFDSDDQIKGPIGLMDTYLKLNAGTIETFREKYKALFGEDFSFFR